MSTCLQGSRDKNHCRTPSRCVAPARSSPRGNPSRGGGRRASSRDVSRGPRSRRESPAAGRWRVAPRSRDASTGAERDWSRRPRASSRDQVTLGTSIPRGIGGAEQISAGFERRRGAPARCFTHRSNRNCRDWSRVGLNIATLEASSSRVGSFRPRISSFPRNSHARTLGTSAQGRACRWSGRAGSDSGALRRHFFGVTLNFAPPRTSCPA